MLNISPSTDKSDGHFKHMSESLRFAHFYFTQKAVEPKFVGQLLYYYQNKHKLIKIS